MSGLGSELCSEAFKAALPELRLLRTKVYWNIAAMFLLTNPLYSLHLKVSSLYTHGKSLCHLQ